MCDCENVALCVCRRLIHMSRPEYETLGCVCVTCVGSAGMPQPHSLQFKTSASLWKKKKKSHHTFICYLLFFNLLRLVGEKNQLGSAPAHPRNNRCSGKKKDEWICIDCHSSSIG